MPKGTKSVFNDVLERMVAVGKDAAGDGADTDIA